MRDLTLWWASSSDVRALGVFLERNAGSSFGMSRRKLATLARSQHVTILLAQVGDAIVGTLTIVRGGDLVDTSMFPGGLFIKRSASVSYYDGLVVAQDESPWFRAKIASALIYEAVTIAKRERTLNAVLISPPERVSFYEKLGFGVISRSVARKASGKVGALMNARAETWRPRRLIKVARRLHLNAI